VVYNLGISGNTTNDLLERMDVECKARIRKHRPKDEFIILVGIGTNDTRFMGKINNPQTIPQDFKDNFDKIIQLAKKHTKKVVFVGLTPVNEKLTNPYEKTFFFNERIKQYNEIMKECCNNKGVLFLDFFEDWISNSNYIGWLGDGLHPNSEGYSMMFEKIKEFLIKNKIIN